MEFYDSTNEDGVASEVWDLTETDSTSYTLKAIARRATRWIYRVGTWMYQAAPDWKWQDSNDTGVTIAEATLVDDQRTYSVPTTALAISGISILDSNGDVKQLNYITEEEIKAKGSNVGEYKETKGIPEEYWVDGKQIYIFPAADTTKTTATDGFRVHTAMKTIDALTASDTTQDMGIPENLQSVIPLGVAYDWWITHDRSKANDIRTEIELYKRDIMHFIRTRNSEADTKITTKHRTNDFV